ALQLDLVPIEHLYQPRFEPFKPFLPTWQNENGGYDYFRWIDPLPENADESSRFVSWNRFIDGEKIRLND
ncbi:hypothetical protein H5410_020667, partial [Solanum commersonii]